MIDLAEGESIPKLFVWSYGQKREPSFPSNFTVIKYTMLHAMDFENNNNKFYYMEIQQAPSDFEGTFKYRVFTHHGRTDELEVKSKNIGQKQCRYCFNEREAQLIYLSILKEKTSEEKGYKTIHLLSISNKIGLSKSYYGVNKPLNNFFFPRRIDGGVKCQSVIEWHRTRTKL